MKQIHITSATNDTVKAWSALALKKNRDVSHTFLVEGEHGVAEAMASGYCLELWVSEETTIPVYPNFSGNVYVSPQAILNKIAQVNSQVSIIGLCKKPTQPITQYNRVLCCDRIQDPGNLGTIIRSALAFGFDGVYVSKDSVDVFNDKVVRSTQGALFHLPIEVVDLKVTILRLKENGVTTIALALHQNSIHDVPLTDHMAFVVGNESVGISKEIQEICDYQRMIAIKNIDSLNVAVAASIIAYEYSPLK